MNSLWGFHLVRQTTRTKARAMDWPDTSREVWTEVYGWLPPSRQDQQLADGLESSFANAPTPEPQPSDVC